MAVEFALVILPFMTLLFAIFELGLVFFVSVVLDGATTRAARQIRTGEFQSAAGTAAAFKTSVCNEMLWLKTGCSSNAKVDVRTYTLFSQVKTAPPPTTGPPENRQFNSANSCFQPGGPTNIVLVRTFYTWTLLTPMLDDSLVNLGSNKRLLSSTVIFRNEPFGATTAAVSC